MTEDTTTEGTGTNSSNTEGDSDTAALENKQEKMIPQSEYNKHVGKARQEGREAGKQAALKELEGKRVLTEEEFAAEIKAAVEVALRDRELQDVKRAIQAEYGLTDAQLGKLSGDDEKALRADAETTFGALKKKDAPNLRAGTNTPEQDTPSTTHPMNKVTNEWLEAELKRLKK